VHTVKTILVALLVLYFLTRTQFGSNLFFKIRGSVDSSAVNG
jgi:hypothetical protein